MNHNEFLNTIEMICTECNRTARFDIESAGFILRCRRCESSFYADDVWIHSEMLSEEYNVFCIC